MVNDESLRDTLIDLHNYSAMAVMLCHTHVAGHPGNRPSGALGACSGCTPCD